jgi:hypothetical protein
MPSAVLSGLYGFDALPITGNGAPSGNLLGQLGQQYFDTSQTPPTRYVFNGQGWNSGISAATELAQGAVTLSSLSQLESGTAPSADYVPSANDVFTFVKTAFTPVAVTSASSSVSLSEKLACITFTGFTTLPGTTQAFTIMNSSITPGSAILCTVTNLNASTNGAQMTVDGITQSAGSIVVNCKNNGTGALGAGDNVNLTFWVMS